MDVYIQLIIPLLIDITLININTIPNMMSLSDDTKKGLLIFACVLLIGGIFVLLRVVMKKISSKNQPKTIIW